MGLFWAMRIGTISYRKVFTCGRAVGCVSARCPTTVARMSTSASIEPDRWEEVLDHLSSMISGKRRADGATWRDAHENMPVYLQVAAVVAAAHTPTTTTTPSTPASQC